MFWRAGSFRIGQLFGIELRLHWLFLALVAFFLLQGAAWGGVTGMIVTALQVGAVFGCVTLHELGHSLAAKRFGIGVRGITLWPLGGVAELDSFGMRPRQEFWITVAGPAVNFALALLLAPFALMGIGPAIWLVAINLIMGTFNLLPAFPMDGGRILRAFLAWRSGDLVRSTEQAVAVSKVVAIGMGVVGLVFNLWLIAIAIFIYTTGEQELAAARARAFMDRPQTSVRWQLDRLVDALRQQEERVFGGPSTRRW